MPNSALLSRLQTELDSLRKAEAKVAQVVLSDPEGAIRSSLSAIAAAAAVSEPTVIRFCRSLGFDGFPDFKIRLAQDLAVGVPFVNPHISAHDDVETYARKIFSSSASVIQTTAARLSPVKVRQAVERLAAARRIAIYGVGGSAAVAMDAYHKLARLNFACQHSSDPIITRMMIPIMGAGDVFLALSYTGRTVSVLELAELARSQAIQVIAITAEDTRLAAIADIALTVPATEDSDLFTPMASRIAMLAVIDVLATGMSLQCSPNTMAQLAEIKAVLRQTRLPRNGSGAD